MHVISHNRWSCYAACATGSSHIAASQYARLALLPFGSKYTDCMFRFDCMIEAHTTHFYERPPITSFAAYRSYRTIMMVNIYLCATTAEHPTSMISRVGTSSDLLERPPIQAVHSKADHPQISRDADHLQPWRPPMFGRCRYLLNTLTNSAPLSHQRKRSGLHR